ncbi:AsmA family protein [Pelistega europaea]|uniref:AsmA family protein n=1 Tax=Pelistega europaea TaxID=106147 RepID=A0A7Y4P717_9BURK|nr:AsmA family protein [Pelistega europaea]NOL50474.1 AsmA family protein [Pelistega europaea]
MKKWFKRIVISCVVLLIVAFIGVAVFILNFDPSAYKNKLAQLIKTQYNRELVVNGDIDLSLFPRIGLTVNQISLSEPGSQEQFVAIDKVRLAVALWPLVSNRFLVDHLAIDGLKANIRRDKDGTYNFEDLLRYSLQPQQEAGGKSGLDSDSLQQRVQNTDFKIDIAGLTLNHGVLHYQDTKNNLVLQDMTIRTGRITEGQQFDLNLAGHLTGQENQVDARLEINGLMLLKPLNQTYAFNRLSADLKGKWGTLNLTQANIKGNVSIDTLENALKGTDLDVRVLGEGTEKSGIKTVSATLSAPKLNYNVSDLSLALDNLKFNSKVDSKDKQSLSISFDAPALDISPSGAGGKPLTGKLQIKSPVKQVDLGFSLDKMTGTAILLNVDKINLSGSYKIDGDKSIGLDLSSSGQISVFKQSVELPDLSGGLTLQEQQTQTIPLKGHIQTLLGEQRVNFFLTALATQGSIDVQGSIEDLFHPRVSFDVSGNQVDLKAFLRDVRLPLGGERNSANSVKPAADTDTSTQNNSLANANNSATTAESQSTTSAAQDASVDTKMTLAEGNSSLTLKQELLSRLSGVGTFNFKHISYDRVGLDNVGATLLFNHSDVKVKSVRADIYGGKLFANGEYSLKNQALTGDVSLSDIQIETLLSSVTDNPKLSGIAQMKAEFSSRGDTEEALLDALHAKLAITAKQGRIQGVNIDEMLSQPQDYANPWDLSASLASEEGISTDFNQIVLESQWQDKQLLIQKFTVSTPTLVLNAKPNVGNYHLGMDYLYLPATLKTKRPFKVKRGSVTVQVKSVELPVLMLGPLSSPDVKLQLDKLLNR